MPPTCRRGADGRLELAVVGVDVALYPHERFLRGFEWRRHSAPLLVAPPRLSRDKCRRANANKNRDYLETLMWGYRATSFDTSHMRTYTVVSKPFVIVNV